MVKNIINLSKHSSFLSCLNLKTYDISNIFSYKFILILFCINFIICILSCNFLKNKCSLSWNFMASTIKKYSIEYTMKGTIGNGSFGDV
jgi:hypothetical protein